jgi:hypothetical protein
MYEVDILVDRLGNSSKRVTQKRKDCSHVLPRCLINNIGVTGLQWRTTSSYRSFCLADFFDIYLLVVPTPST